MVGGLSYLTHGGDVYSALFAGQKAPIDFSSNINPLGMPRAAVRALKKNAARFSAYPDPLCRCLRAALAVRFGVPAERIVCGAGAADLIYRLVRGKKPRTALVVQPSFSEYEKALCEAGAAVERFYLKPPGFELDAAILPQITGDTGMIFLCNPNNPTGRLIGRELVRDIVERCRRTGTLLVIDECFLGFVDGGEAYSAVRFLDGPPGLVVLNAFTKTYALAGLRLGFALFSSAALAAETAALGQSWPCSLAAEYAALAALGDSVYLEKSRALFRAERRRLYNGLSALGLEVIEGAANYLFFRLPEGQGGAAGMPAQKSASLRIFELGVLRRSTAAKHQHKALFHRHPWRHGCEAALVSKSDGTPAFFDKLKNRQGRAAGMPLGEGMARSDVVSKSDGTPSNSKYQNFTLFCPQKAPKRGI